MISFISLFLMAWVLPAVLGFGAPRVEAPRGSLLASRSALFATDPAAAAAKAPKAPKAAAAKTDKSEKVILKRIIPPVSLVPCCLIL